MRKREHLNLIKHEFASGDNVKDAEKATPKRSIVRRFLLWTSLMKTSTYDKDGETQTEDRWNVGMVVLIITLYVTVIGVFVVLLILGALYFLEMRENQRGNDAWKQKELYNNWQKSRNECLENAEKLRGLVLYSQQRKQEVPPEFLQVKTCGEAEVLNKQQ